MKRDLRYLSILFCILTFASCKKDPGSGGNSAITGYVHLTVINNVNFYDTLAVQDGFNEDVFIVYGDDISFGDRIRTGNDGKFEFSYLRKGKYKIYVYSEVYDTLGIGSYVPDVTISKSIEITSKKQTLDAGTFEISKFKWTKTVPP